MRRARDAHAKRFNYDLDAIVADFKEREKELGLATVSLPPKRTRRKKSARKGI